MKLQAVAILALVAIGAYTLLSNARTEASILGQTVWNAGNQHTYVLVELPGETWINAGEDLNALLLGYHMATITKPVRAGFGQPVSL